MTMATETAAGESPLRDDRLLGDWLLGDWRMARIVAGPAGERIASFAGRCRFGPGEEGLVCREEGLLRTGGTRSPAARVTLWRFGAGEGIEVRFADGRPFHAFLESRPEAVHLCGEDTYRVRYAFGERVWHSRWDVSGPFKRYVMTTRYRRSG